MTQQPIARAALWKLDARGQVVGRYNVQFNPDTLKVTYANQNQPPSSTATDTQHGTAATQFVGRGTSKLAVILWFDVNAELPQGVTAPHKDVRDMTNTIVALIEAGSASQTSGSQPTPPAVRFIWGSFQFEGLIDSIDQTLEFFSPEGIPLRASLAINMTQQNIEYGVSPNRAAASSRGGAGSLPGGAPPGTSPMTPAAIGSTLQSMASALGKFNDWPAIAAANGIENPRRLVPGQLIDLNIRLPRIPD